MNFVLIRLSPLVISTAATTEPVFGTLIGSIFFSNDYPSMWTYIGGSILLFGIILVVNSNEVSDEERLEGDEQNSESTKVIELTEII